MQQAAAHSGLTAAWSPTQNKAKAPSGPRGRSCDLAHPPHPARPRVSAALALLPDTPRFPSSSGATPRPLVLLCYRASPALQR